MKTTGNAILIDNYFGLLRGLSRENKIQLMAKLSNSIAEEEVVKEDIVDRFYGAFETERSAESIIDEIRNNRMFNRIIEPF